MNIAIFSALDSTLLRPFALRNPKALSCLWETNPKVAGPVAMRLPVAALNFIEWRKRLHAFERIEALRRAEENLTGWGSPENVSIARVTTGFFRLMGRGPASGRAFEPGDGIARVAVVSAEFFARHFRDNANALGRELVLNDVAYTIVGVMPADFHLPALREGMEVIRPDVWIPMNLDADGVQGSARNNYVFARLRGGVSLDYARSELAGVAAALAREYPRLNAGFGAAAFSFAEEDAGPSARRALMSLAAGAIFVLLIACANLAHLLLTRASGRARETAIRAALGASRAQVAREALTESMLLANGGVALGLAFARGMIVAIDRLAPESAYHLHTLQIGGRAIAFAFVLALLTAGLFGIAPAIAAASIKPSGALAYDERAGAPRSAHRYRGGLLAAEAAFAVALLSAAGLMIRTMSNLACADTGVNAARVFTLRVRLPQARYASPARTRIFCDRLLESAAAIPGVESAALATGLPLLDALAVAPYRLRDQAEPRPGEHTMADFRGVSENYFAVTGTKLLRGRAFTRQDAAAASPRVAVINDALAKQLSRFGDPLEKTLIVGDGPKAIVGIVAGAHQAGVDAPQRPEIFLPTRAINSMALLLRTGGNPDAAGKAAIAAVWAIDPDQPATNIRSLEEHIRRGAAQRRFETALFAAFAALALILAAAGMYGVVSHSVAQRTRELGVRMALGAHPAAICWAAMRDALRMTALGIVAGTMAGLAFSRSMRGLLFGVSTADPATFGASAAVLLAAAALASWIPAARAARLNPSQSLRD